MRLSLTSTLTLTRIASVSQATLKRLAGDKRLRGAFLAAPWPFMQLFVELDGLTVLLELAQVGCLTGEGVSTLPCEPTRSTLHIIWSCGLFEGKGVSTSRVSPPAHSLCLSLFLQAGPAERYFHDVARYALEALFVVTVHPTAQVRTR
jgi:hypothetical protein